MAPPDDALAYEAWQERAAAFLRSECGDKAADEFVSLPDEPWRDRLRLQLAILTVLRAAL